MNIRSTSKQYQQVRKFCLTDTSSLLQIIQSSPNRLSDTDGRKFILADTFVGIEGLGDFRGKDLRPNAFMKIEVIKTENPNHVKLVLNGSEATDDSEDNEDESWAEESSGKEELLSITH